MSTLITPAAPGPEQQDAPLTETERKQLVRYLSDPTYFPIEFRTWIRTYLEGSDIRLPSSAIVGGNAPKVELPAGCIMPFAGDTIPSNCLFCNGQEVLRADYELLFQAIGVIWGVGNGTSTFNVPDLRDRALYGAGTVVGRGATDGRSIGSRGGPIHRHQFNQTSGGGGGHSHGVSGSTDNPGQHSHGPGNANFPEQGGVQTGASGSARYTVQNPVNNTGGSGAHTHGVSGGTDGVGDHNHNVSGDTSGAYDYDMSAYAGIFYIIATGKAV